MASTTVRAVVPPGGGRSALVLGAVLACVLATSTNGQNTTGTYTDVTQTVTSQVPGRFGTQPSARSGQTMVRSQAARRALQCKPNQTSPNDGTSERPSLSPHA